jgi:beta-phosphoglucomutase-like phosphatase (HAD superfamily)
MKTKSMPVFDFDGTIVGSVFLVNNVVQEATAHGKFIHEWVGKEFTDTQLSNRNFFTLAV